MLGVNPYLSFNGNCRDVIEFYTTALGAEVLFCQTIGESPMSGMGAADNIMHCTLKVGGSTVMMSDDPGGRAAANSGNISLALGIGDADEARRLFDNLAAGGTVIMPLEKTFWADAFGMLTDKFGVKWMINCEAPRPA